MGGEAMALIPFNSNQHTPRMEYYRDERVDSVFLARLPCLRNGRNAWNSQWRSSELECFEPNKSLEAIEEDIKPRRRQGTRWTLWEEPAVAFAGLHFTMLASLHNRVAKELSPPALESKVTLESVRDQLAEANWTCRLCHSKLVRPATLPFWLKEFPNGGSESVKRRWQDCMEVISVYTARLCSGTYFAY